MRLPVSTRAIRRSILDSWLLCLGLLACAARAHAEPRSIAILALASDDDGSVAGAFTSALRSEAADDPGLRPSSSRASLSQMTMAQDCEIADAQCRERIASALAAQLVIYGDLRRAGEDSYEVELHMFGAQGAAPVTAKRQLPADETGRAELARHARALLHALLGTPDDPSEASQAPSAATVTPDVQPLHQAGVDSSEPVSHAAPASNDWIGYTLLGVAGVSLGLTVFSWAQVSSAGDDESLAAYRKVVGATKPSVADVCDEADKRVTYGLDSKTFGEARDACSRGRTFERLQYVFLGAALVAVGVGTYFLLDDERPAQARSGSARMTLRPSFGHGSASLGVRLEL